MGDKKLIVRTPLELHREALKKARCEGLTLSEIIRHWLALWLSGDLPSPLKRV